MEPLTPLQYLNQASRGAVRRNHRRRTGSQQKLEENQFCSCARAEDVLPWRRLRLVELLRCKASSSQIKLRPFRSVGVTQEVNVTFTFLGGWLLPLLRATPSPLHPLPAAEHVVVLIRGHLLRILVLREDACEDETR